MGIGSKLQAVLDAANIRPATMAADIGISKNTIYGILKRDNRKVEIDTLIEIANYLNVPLDYFLKDSSSMHFLSPEALQLGYRYDRFDERGKQLLLALADAIERTQADASEPCAADDNSLGNTEMDDEQRERLRQAAQQARNDADAESEASKQSGAV